MNDSNQITIVGAGLAGSLLAVLLARRGFDVQLFERFPDQRRATIPAGRSINLALAERGRTALRRAGLLDSVDAFAIPMAGRMLHEPGETPHLQRYGQRDDEVIYSVHRAKLNQHLLNAAETAGAAIHFERCLQSVDFDAGTACFIDRQGTAHEHSFEVIIGADGAGSAVRAAMAEVADIGTREEPLDHGYKELTIPPGPGADGMETHALHIWPRGGYMMIALPNPDGSFTCTLFLPRKGEPSFEMLDAWPKRRAFMNESFPDAVPLIPELEREFQDNPVGYLGTLRCDRWHLDGRALILGDASHAVVPFHGQGMNAAFEDVAELDRLLEQPGGWSERFAEFQRRRKPNADAIATMALENYEEMRSAVRDPRFHLKKQLEWELERRLPGRFIPRYSMVMFHTLPYVEAQTRGRAQAELLTRYTEGKTLLEDIDLEGAMRDTKELLPEITAE